MIAECDRLSYYVVLGAATLYAGLSLAAIAYALWLERKGR